MALLGKTRSAHVVRSRRLSDRPTICTLLVALGSLWGCMKPPAATDGAAVAGERAPTGLPSAPPPQPLPREAGSDAPLEAASAQPLDAGVFVRRCGWVDNPTPANWWLVDRDGEWVIGVQGGHQAEGDLPDFGKDWVETNGHHGYGCACMEMVADPRTKVVERVRNVRVLPIDRCRRDTHLPRR